MKKYFYALCMATALGTVGCSDDKESVELDNSMKTPIQFSMTDEGGSAITKADPMTRAGFKNTTAIVMKMKSVNSTDASDVKYTVTNAEAGEEDTSKKYSAVTFTNSTSVINQRYWDDAHGRNSKLSIFAVAVPNQSTASEQLKLKDGTPAGSWFTEATENLKIDWTVTNTSTTAENINKEDLVYSNNIQKGSSENGVVEYKFTTSQYTDYDGEHFTTQLTGGMMQFRLKETAKSDGPGKFDRGHLNFKHALSRVTLNIKADEGFVPADYTDDKVKEVHLNNVPYKGTFNVQDGTWNAATTTTGNVDLVKEETPDATFHLKYTGQIVPEYVIRKGNENVNMLQFTINNNVYYVTDKMVYDALNRDNATLLASDKDPNDNIVMKPGKNYVLNITVKKTKIESITATLADWLPVTGSHTQNNAYLTFSNFVEKGNHCVEFDLYRIEDKSDKPSTTDGEHQGRDWYSGYSTSEKAELTPNPAGSNTWKTNWYFESNIHFYHFRTVKQGTTIKPGTAPDPKDYFEIETGKDYHWGAPMIQNGGKDPKYDLDKGYEDFISYAIGATESTIKLQEFHMMSQVDIVLTTTADLDKVSLYDEKTKTGTTVKITKIFQNGKVEMGRGLVSTKGTTSDYTVESSPATTSADTYYETQPSDGVAAKSKVYTSFVVPQSLKQTGAGTGGADVYVGLEIQTPDKNMYYVVQKLSKITASVTSSDDGYNHKTGDEITQWYPGHHYTYTLTLKKTGIDKITCSLANWKEISGSSDVTLED